MDQNDCVINKKIICFLRLINCVPLYEKGPFLSSNQNIRLS